MALASTSLIDVYIDIEIEKNYCNLEDYEKHIVDELKLLEIVIIKPSKKSNYKNLVDILDEMAIADIQTYVIVNDYTPDETKLLAAK